MTQKTKTRMRCPKCGQIIEFYKITEIDVDEDPQFRSKMFDMSFFDHKCEKCAEEFRLLYDVIYRDEEYKIIIYFCPHEAVACGTFPGYKARSVKSFDRLREKIVCLERNLDDRAIELLKLLLKAEYEQNGGQDMVDLLFWDIDNNANQIFVIIKQDGTQEQIVTLASYYLNIADQVEKECPDPDWSICSVDDKWAYEFLLKNS